MVTTANAAPTRELPGRHSRGRFCSLLVHPRKKKKKKGASCQRDKTSGKYDGRRLSARPSFLPCTARPQETGHCQWRQLSLLPPLPQRAAEWRSSGAAASCSLGGNQLFSGKKPTAPSLACNATFPPPSNTALTRRPLSRALVATGNGVARTVKKTANASSVPLSFSPGVHALARDPSCLVLTGHPAVQSECLLLRGPAAAAAAS